MCLHKAPGSPTKLFFDWPPMEMDGQNAAANVLDRRADAESAWLATHPTAKRVTRILHFLSIWALNYHESVSMMKSTAAVPRGCLLPLVLWWWQMSSQAELQSLLDEDEDMHADWQVMLLNRILGWAWFSHLSASPLAETLFPPPPPLSGGSCLCSIEGGSGETSWR